MYDKSSYKCDVLYSKQIAPFVRSLWLFKKDIKRRNFILSLSKKKNYSEMKKIILFNLMKYKIKNG